MKKMRTIDKILSPVDLKYGAPMGMSNVGVRPTDGTRIYDSAIPLSEGYSKNGVYWGSGEPLRVEYTKDLSYVRFYRGYKPGKQAKAALRMFVSEFRTMCSDVWGDALDAWFEVLGNMYLRGLPIKADRLYRPAAGNPTEKDSYFHDWLKNLSDDSLVTIEYFLFRYCQILKRHGKDY